MKPVARLLAFLVASLASGHALEFARPFGDSMVLPHGRPFEVWGTGEAGASVQLRLGSATATTRCAKDGSWRVQLGPLQPSTTPASLEARSGTALARLADLLVGEVWLCSGQSNMDFPLDQAIGGREAAAQAARFPRIRLCNLTPVHTRNAPYGPAEFARLNLRDHFQGTWTQASPATAAKVSAVAWWTATLVQAECPDLPIGLVENAVGGSGAEAWLPRETLESRPEYRSLRGETWLESDHIGAWTVGRARHNLGGHREAMHPYRPSFLFESGVRGWIGFPFHRVLWYQGESNAEVDDDAWNERLIVDLVQGWRKALRDPDLPFAMVQLPRIGGKDPLRARWPEFRQVQSRAAARLEHVTLVPTQDLGWDSPDVHPPDKLPVARRLAAAIVAGTVR